MTRKMPAAAPGRTLATWHRCSETPWQDRASPPQITNTENAKRCLDTGAPPQYQSRAGSSHNRAIQCPRALRIDAGKCDLGQDWRGCSLHSVLPFTLTGFTDTCSNPTSGVGARYPLATNITMPAAEDRHHRPTVHCRSIANSPLEESAVLYSVDIASHIRMAELKIRHRLVATSCSSNTDELLRRLAAMPHRGGYGASGPIAQI